jgi:hypothetical protein
MLELEKSLAQILEKKLHFDNMLFTIQNSNPHWIEIKAITIALL